MTNIYYYIQFINSILLCYHYTITCILECTIFDMIINSISIIVITLSYS